MNSFKELAQKRRSIRKYKDERVTDEELREILEVALTSPAAKNRNGVNYLVIRDKEKLEKLSVMKKAGAAFLKDVDVAILVMCDTELVPDTYFQDECIAATMIQLQAADMGLGSCWGNVVGGMYDENTTTLEYLRKTFEIDKKFDIQCVLGIGIPSEIPHEKTPRDFDTFVHFENL